MRKRRSFSREFKREAVSMVVDQGFSAGDVSHQLDVGETALRRWVKQVQFERDGGVPQGPALTEEQREIQLLKSRIKQLEQEKMILKKATECPTALLVSDEINR